MSGGIKHDQGKAAMDLLPTEALREVAKVLGYGANKYDRFNWRKGMAWSRLHASTLRHIAEWSEGRDRDNESGLLHLAHAAAGILFLLTYQVLGLGVDDRWKDTRDGVRPVEEEEGPNSVLRAAAERFEASVGQLAETAVVKMEPSTSCNCSWCVEWALKRKRLGY